MRAVSCSTALALSTLYVGLIDTLAFLPFNGRGRGRGQGLSQRLSPSPISTSQIAFWIGNGNGSNNNNHHAHHRRRPTTTRTTSDTALHAAEESAAAAAAAQAAFMSAAPLLLAPLAALAYGSQALNAKDQLELDLAATEIRLQDIKEQSRRSQLQATSSFALALASAGIVAFNTFGDIATRTATAGGATSSTFFDQMEKNEVLFMSPGQESTTNKLLEKMESLGAATTGTSSGAMITEDWSSTTSAIVAEPTIDAEQKQSDVITSGSSGEEAEKMDDVTTDSVEESMEEIVARLNKLLAKDAVPAETTRGDESGTEIPPPQNDFEPMIAIPGSGQVDSAAGNSVPSSDGRMTTDDDDAQKDSQADTVMSKLEAAMKSFMSKTEIVESQPIDSETKETVLDEDQIKPAESVVEPKANVEVSGAEAVDESAIVDNAQMDEVVTLREPAAPTVSQSDAAVDDVMSKLDEAMNKVQSKSTAGSTDGTVEAAPKLTLSDVEEGQVADDILTDEGAGSVSDDTAIENLSPERGEDRPEPVEPPKSFFESFMTRLGVTTEVKEAHKPAAESAAADELVDDVMSKLDEAMSKLVSPNSDSIVEAPNTVTLPVIEDRATSEIISDEGVDVSSDVVADSVSPAQQEKDEMPEPAEPPKSLFETLMTKLGATTDENEADKVAATTSSAADVQVDGVMSKLDEAMNQLKPNSGSAVTGDTLTNEGVASLDEAVAESTSPILKVESAEQAGTESIYDNLLSKLETAMEEKSAAEVSEGMLSSSSIVPDEVISSEVPSSVAIGEGTGIATESAQDQTFSAVAIDDEVPTPEMDRIGDDSLSSEESPEAPAIADDETPSIVEELSSMAEVEEEAVVENEDAPVSDLTIEAPTATTEEALSETTLSPPVVEESSLPVLTLPASQSPSASAPSVIRITGLENMDPAVYQTAAAIAAGAVLVGILASVGDDTATMAVGQKEEKSTYLDGLTRSSATSSGAKPDMPPDYLDTLKASTCEVAKATQSPQAPRAMGTGSYLENLSSSNQPPGPGYGLNNGATSGSVTLPIESKPPPSKPLTVTNASQFVASSQPPADPRASIPKSQFPPASERPSRPATIPPAAAPPREVSRQRVPEPKKTAPGLSYLDTMAQGSSGPRRVPPPANRNDLGSVRKIDPPKAVPGLSYLERMNQAPPPRGYTQPPGSIGTGSPPKIEPPKSVPGLSYLERMNEAAPSNGSTQPSSFSTGPPPMIDAPKAVPGTSYLERMNQAATSNGYTQPPSSFGAGPPPKIEPPKAVPGLSYLERMNQANASNGSAQPYTSSIGTVQANGSSFGTAQPPYSNGKAAMSSPPPFQQGAASPGAQWSNAGGPRAPPTPPFQSFADSLARQNGQMAGPRPPAQTNSNVGPPGGVTPPFQSFSDSLSRQNGQQQQQQAYVPPSLANAEDRMTQTNVGSRADKTKPKAPAGFGSYLDTL